MPVPHGERSYALPGHSTKFLLSIRAIVGAPNSSMWSISAPSLARTPFFEAAPDRPGEMGELVDIAGPSSTGRGRSKKKPIATPCDIATDGTVTGNVDPDDLQSAGWARSRR